MLNKFYKIIHKKYLILFKFIFFLRYLFVIFITSIILFLSIPYLFDYEKKDAVIKNYLLENYNIKLDNYESIKYKFLPVPNLEIQNAKLKIKENTIRITASYLIIYPKLLNIYNFENFKSNKIILNKNSIILKDTELKKLIIFIYNLKNKLIFKNLDLRVNYENKILLNFNKINFSNYGYKKNIISGELFGKKFELSSNENYRKIKFKLLKTGLIADVTINEINSKKDFLISGVFKTKLLNSNLKFNFDFNKKKLKIYKSYLRNRKLSFNNESTIIFQPYLNLSSIINIEEIDLKIFKEIDLDKILTVKDFIKKINTKNIINFKSKKFSKNLIDDLNLNIDLSYGRLVYSKQFLILNNVFTCQGNVNLLEEYPILYFDCSVVSNDKKKLLKKFSIKYKNKNEAFNLFVKGNINILNNKINFKEIKTNNNYIATKTDMNYFKQSFERIIFDENFLDIFSLKKIKDFILEIS